MSRLLILPAALALIMSGGCCKSSPGVQVVAAEAAPAPHEAPVASADEKSEPAAAESAAPPAFADDSGRKLAARVLAPPQPRAPGASRRTRPLVRPWLPALERPEAPIAPPLTVFISLPLPRRAALSPRPLAEVAPLIDYVSEPAPPRRPELPPTRLIRTPSRDVNLPIVLPAQAKYQPDRAALEDPTADFSLESAQGAALRLRDKPAPFVRVNLPEPFENRAEIRSAAPEPPVVAPVPQPPK